jgi:hypothetical protein
VVVKVAGQPDRVVFVGNLTRAPVGRDVVFSDGIVLRLAAGVQAPDVRTGPARVEARIDPASHEVRLLVPL